MSANSKIEWTETTWNPVRGCTRVSPGCEHCYAERMAARFVNVKNAAGAVIAPGKFRGFATHSGWTGRVDLIPDKLTEPLHWRKPRMCFVNSMSDLYHKDLPDAARDQIHAVMALTPHITYQVLTKRAKEAREYWTDINSRALKIIAAMADHAYLEFEPDALEFPLPNVHLGVSVESPDYLWRLDELERCPAAVRWASFEPLLADLGDISRYLFRTCAECGTLHKDLWPHDSCSECNGALLPALDWAVIGGESGPGARPFDLTWARSIIAQCKAADVPVFFKQAGSAPYYTEHIPGGATVRNIMRLKSSKGGDPTEWPEDLRVREYPVAARAMAEVG